MCLPSPTDARGQHIHVVSTAQAPGPRESHLLPIIQEEVWGWEHSSIIAKWAPDCEISIEAVSSSKWCNQRGCLWREESTPFPPFWALDHMCPQDYVYCIYLCVPRAWYSAWHRTETPSYSLSACIQKHLPNTGASSSVPPAVTSASLAPVCRLQLMK